MSRSSDPRKLAMWRKRFQRFSSSRLAVAPFCARERVSVASFYHWRKKLGPQVPRRPTSVRGDVFQPVALVPAAWGVSIRLPGGTQIEVIASEGTCVQIDSTQLAMLLGGVSLVGVRRRKRYHRAS